MGGLDGVTGSLKKKLLLAGVALVLLVAILWGLVYGVRLLKEKRAQRNEAQAVETLRTIKQALATFRDRYDGYPDRLERLRGGEDGEPATAPPERARLLDTQMAKNQFEQNGYRFRYRRGAPVDRWAATMQLVASYQLTASPIEPGGTGNKFYFTDSTGAIHVREGKEAGPDDPEVP
jgi:hypothetical protein